MIIQIVLFCSRVKTVLDPRCWAELWEPGAEFLISLDDAGCSEEFPGVKPELGHVVACTFL